MDKFFYLVPGKMGVMNAKAAMDLLRESYHVIKTGPAPMGIGLLCEVSTAVTLEHQEVLGLLPWN